MARPRPKWGTSTLLFGLVLGAISCSDNLSISPAEPVIVRWLIGFGAGLADNQLAVEQAVVDEFNATHDDIKIEIIVRELFAGSPEWDELKASDTPPDIIGPVGESASIAYAADWAVLTREDLGEIQYDPEILENVSVEGGYSGVPVGIYPSMFIINRRAFERESITLPPDRFDVNYENQTWDWSTVRDLAKKLTIDVEGRNAMNENFDDVAVTQFGFAPHRVLISVFGHSFAQGETDWSGSRAEPPIGVIEGWKWLSELVFDDQSAPDQRETGSDHLNGGQPFSSGNVAMSLIYSWALPAVSSTPEVRGDVVFAVPPSHNGVSQVPYNFDQFKVSALSKNPDAAITAMQYILNTKGEEVIPVWGPVPAQADLRDEYVATMQSMFPGSNFSEEFVAQLLSRLSIPSQERAMSLTGASDAAATFADDLLGSPNNNVDEVIDRFLRALKEAHG